MRWQYLGNLAWCTIVIASGVLWWKGVIAWWLALLLIFLCATPLWMAVGVGWTLGAFFADGPWVYGLAYLALAFITQCGLHEFREMRGY